jgi:hypothetical protein
MAVDNFRNGLPCIDWTRLDTKVLLTKDKNELDESPQLRSEPLLFSDAEGNLTSDLSLNKYPIKGGSERVDMLVDNKHGLINSRCVDLSRPEAIVPQLVAQLQGTQSRKNWWQLS